MADNENKKTDGLKSQKRDTGERLTTNQGTRIADNQNTLTAGERGPQLMEDFIFREKMTHFDHERIPERVVHARGSAAHGYFQPYEGLKDITMAQFLQDPSEKTPVFVRFSTVVGFRGSVDTVRDVRGFATKFYTKDGVFDLVGNNMPVFFIQDAIKFPDLVHAIKPEPHNEMPQASAAHDNFWDFVSLMPESMHMIMWVLSDRALPRSYAMMEGFGVHTFRFVNEEGKTHFVKFHWKPMEGLHSLVWDETQKIAGKDPDFNRRDLWERIEAGNYPEYEFAVQTITEDQANNLDFDILDATKIWPEEEVPMRRIGKMVLNRNPDNFFAETEQVAFHPGHIVPGIDFTNDPLLQGRLFSYLDTQLIRLGGPNFHEIPINRPLAEVHNNQRDGFMRQTIDKGRVNYEPNSLAKGCPMQSPRHMRGFVSHMEKMEGHKVRIRPESFQDHYSQARMFYRSQSKAEQEHIVEALWFELGKVEHMHVREKMVEHLNRIDHDLAVRAAKGIGVAPPENDESVAYDKISPALSMQGTHARFLPKGRKVAILVADGFNHKEVEAVQKKLKKENAEGVLISKTAGPLKTADGEEAKADKMFVATASVMFDGVYVPGGQQSVETLMKQGDAVHFIAEAYKHHKLVAASGEGVSLLRQAWVNGEEMPAENGGVASDKGVVTVGNGGKLDEFAEELVNTLSRHRFWERSQLETIPA